MKKKKNILLVWMMLITGETGLLCQTTLFNKSYDYHSHLETMEAAIEYKNGYFAIMRTANAPDECKRIIVMYLNLQGDTIWTRTHYIDQTAVWLTEGLITKTLDGGFVVAGVISTPNTEYDNGVLIKFSATGGIIWQKEYGGGDNDYFASYKKTPDGGYILGGASRSIDPQGDFYLVKTDSEGEVEWESHIGGPGYHSGYAVDYTADGGYVISGRAGVPPFNIDIAVAKCDANGEQLWSRTYGGPFNNDSPHKVKVLSDNTILVSGAMGNNLGVTEYSINSDAYLLKLDQEGEVIWQEVYDNAWTTIHGSEPLELADGSIVVTGIQYINEDQIHASINKYDSAGTPLWSRLYAGENPYADNYLYGITSTEDGGFLAMGSTYDPNWTNFQEGWLLRLDSLGYTCNPVGCAEVLNTTAVEEAEVEGEAWSVYPNPSNGLVHVEWPGSEWAELRLYALTGQELWRGVYEAGMTLDVQHYPAGLYLLRLQWKAGVLSKSILLNH